MTSLSSEADRLSKGAIVITLPPVRPNSDPPIAPDLVALASAVYRLRRARDQLFGADLFHDPPWDLMLDLFVAGATGRSISITSACIAACVPPSTALRHLAALEEIGHVERVCDLDDRRRNLVRLSANATEMIAELLGRFLESQRSDRSGLAKELRSIRMKPEMS